MLFTPKNYHYAYQLECCNTTENLLQLRDPADIIETALVKIRIIEMKSRLKVRVYTTCKNILLDIQNLYQNIEIRSKHVDIFAETLDEAFQIGKNIRDTIKNVQYTIL